MIAQMATDERALFRLAVAVVVGITAVRILVLIFTPLQLYPDEAQYWWWAQVPGWGYFSKPPLIAWIIWLTTRLSDAEWAIRLASPLLHAGTALLLFGIGRLSFDARVGFWSALAYATLPGTSYSSSLISTDAPLLFCWAAALYAFLRASQEKGWRWPVVCGVFLGLGLLAKYAMLYFLLGAIIAATLVPSARRLVLSARGAAIVMLGFLILSPNLAWNAAHGFPTLAHTEANANWGHAKYNLGNAAAFIASQFGIFGPLMMAGFIGALWRLWSHAGQGERGHGLAAFSLPVLLLVVAQSFISDANANWAAPAYVAAVPLATATLLERWSARTFWLSLALALATMVALWTAELEPALADVVGLGNGVKRQQGWKELGQAVAAEAKPGNYDAIAAANRSVLAELLYYARPRRLPIRAYDRNSVPRDHFQMTMPLTAASYRVLMVVGPEEAQPVLATFDSHRLIRQLSIPLGHHHVRVLALHDVHGFRAPQAFR